MVLQIQQKQSITLKNLKPTETKEYKRPYFANLLKFFWSNANAWLEIVNIHIHKIYVGQPEPDIIAVWLKSCIATKISSFQNTQAQINTLYNHFQNRSLYISIRQKFSTWKTF